MSKVVDNRIVEMGFNNKQFESGVKTSLDSINELKKGLNFENAVKGLSGISNISKSFSLETMAQGVQSLSDRFSTLGIIGMTAIQNITNSAIEYGKQIVQTFVKPIKDGLNEYETQINAIQTILANTESKGTTIDDVTASLDELNEYADMTIYNFSEMTRNIGTFTAAGVELDTSVDAIKGIANLAAVSGSNSQQASTAMYQLSQALSSGTLKLMDWNSVVNAGMGGQIFQDALKETGRVHGLAIDDFIEQDGSFRETLQRGWITTDILLETLQKFTGDLSAEQLKSIGYTEDQIAAIMKLGETATDAATKVKTITQLKDTLAEAMGSGWATSWRIIIGDFHEAKELFTEISDTLGGLIGAASDSRNEMLQSWKDWGGRTLLIESVRNAFNGLMGVLTPIGEAMKEVFPPYTLAMLKKLTITLHAFSKKLLVSDDAAKKIKSVFKGVFTVFKFLIDIVSALTTGFIGLFKLSPGKSGGGVLSFLEKMSERFVELEKGLAIGEKIKSAFTTLGNILKPLLNELSILAGSVILIFTEVKRLITELFENIRMSFSGVFDGFKNNAISWIEDFITKGGKTLNDLLISIKSTLSGLGNQSDKVSLKFYKFTKSIKDFGKKIKDSFSNIKFKNPFEGLFKSLNTKNLSDGVKKIDFNKVFSFISAGLATTLVLSFVKFLGQLGKVADSAGDILKGVTGILDGVRGSLEAWQLSLKAKALLQIAAAIAILAISVIAISMVDPVKLAASLAAITAMFAQLVTSLSLMSKIPGGGTQMILSLIGLSAAILIMSFALSELSKIDPEVLGQGLVAVAALIVPIVAFSKVLSTENPNMIKGAVAIGILAVSLMLLSGSIRLLGSIDPVEIQNGLITMSGALLAITLAFKFMPKDVSMIKAAVSVGILALSLMLLAGAVKLFSLMSVEEIAVGFITITGLLAILVVSLNTMKTTLAGSAALVVAAIAIGMLVPSLMLLGNMKLEQIGIGLLAIAGIFVVFGLAGLLLGPVVPVLLGLSVAITLFGIATALVGVGVLKFALGLAAVVGISAALVGTITLILGAIASMIPVFAKAIADGLGAFGEAISENAPKLADGIKSIFLEFIKIIRDVTPPLLETLGDLLLQLIDLIITVIPDFVDAILTLVDELLKSLANKMPSFVDSGMDILLSFLKGIRDNIFEIVTVAIDIATEFIDAVAEKIPDIIDSGYNLIISFIDGLATSIDENAPELYAAIGRLATAIVTGLTDGLTNGVRGVKAAIGRLAGGAIDALKTLLGIFSPSKVFYNLGEEVPVGFAGGIVKMAYMVADATKNLGKKAIIGLNGAISKINDTISNNLDMSPTIRPVVDLGGIISGGKEIDKLLNQKNLAFTPYLSSNIAEKISSTGNFNAALTDPSSSVSFIQNNYSPKALSSIDIYRQTRNQLLTVKGLVAKT